MRRVVLVLSVLVVAMQFVPVTRTNPPVVGDLGALEPTRSVLRAACYDCHSRETVWPWYARVAPVSWLLAHDVSEGREHLDFSAWTSLGPRRRAKLLGEMAEEVEEGEMPPFLYRAVHPEARLDDVTHAALVAWAKEAQAAAAAGAASKEARER